MTTQNLAENASYEEIKVLTRAEFETKYNCVLLDTTVTFGDVNDNQRTIPGLQIKTKDWEVGVNNAFVLVGRCAEDDEDYEYLKEATDLAMGSIVFAEYIAKESTSTNWNGGDLEGEPRWTDADLNAMLEDLFNMDVENVIF